MIGQSTMIRSAAAAVVALGAAVLTTPAAQAQSVFWDWGGSQDIGGAGKQSVHFPSNYKTGEIIVSFGDRKLYHVTGAGTASAYPIAIPARGPT